MEGEIETGDEDSGEDKKKIPRRVPTPQPPAPEPQPETSSNQNAERLY